MWWSATTAWRLLRCPASASPAPRPIAPRGPNPYINAGILAHEALQTWVENREWTHADLGNRLQERFDEAAAARGADQANIPQAILTRARLSSRAKELAKIFAHADYSRIRSEMLLVDEKHQLFGILDVVGTGEGGFILDLKTGRDQSESTAAINYQMTFYSHLFHATYGVFPARLIVFSLQRGSAEIEVAPHAITDLPRRIHDALEGGDTAHPAAETCRFCPKRMACDAHWDDVKSWDGPDAIEGVIRLIEESTSGKSALLIGNKWLTGVPKGSLPTDASPGQFLRAIRVRHINDGTVQEWATTRSTVIRTAS